MHNPNEKKNYIKHTFHQHDVYITSKVINYAIL